MRTMAPCAPTSRRRAIPIIRTLTRIYPGLLQPLDSMPADLRAHVRYPAGSFQLQTALFATYHMANPETFYHREDQWQIPNVPVARTRASRRAGRRPKRSCVTWSCGCLANASPEFIHMRPFTPRQKDNLAAWMVARNDGANYGKLVVYRFPRQSLVFGPNQIVNRINQDTEVARQITLWDQRGSEVLRGELLVLPIEGALIYVQPLYLRAQGGRIPELKRVVAAHEGRVSMAETLDGALAALLGGVCRCADSTPPWWRRLRERDAAWSGRREHPTVAAGVADSRSRRANTTIARGRRSAPTTGRRTARRCAGSVRCCDNSRRGGKTIGRRP